MIRWLVNWWRRCQAWLWSGTRPHEWLRYCEECEEVVRLVPLHGEAWVDWVCPGCNESLWVVFFDETEEGGRIRIDRMRRPKEPTGTQGASRHR